MSFTPTDTVLVTGANGHVGQHVLAQLLALPPLSRPHVRAAVRNPSSAAPLEAAFAAALAAGALSLVYVPDIVAPDAYAAAVHACTHIAHLASPLVLAPRDLEADLVRPAVAGTTGLLRAALAHAAPSLRAVVLTSSFAAAFDPFAGARPGYAYGGADWSPLTHAQGAGREAIAPDALSPALAAFVPYLSSKKLAEAAAWEVYRAARPAWRLCAVLPTYIGGPSVVGLRGEDGTEGYSFSQKILTGIALDGRVPQDDFPTWVDVRDVARAHVAALLRSEASEEPARWILSAKGVTMGDLAGIVRAEFPGLGGSGEVDGLKEGEYFDIKREEAQKALGIEEWIGIEAMVRDTIAPILEHRRKNHAES